MNVFLKLTSEIKVMTPSLKISQIVLNKLINLKQACSGKLYGTVFEDSLVVLGLSIDQEGITDIHNFLPAEVDLCGVVQIGSGTINIAKTNKSIKDVFVTDNPIVVSVKIGERNELKARYIVNDRFEKIAFEDISENEINSQFTYLRLKFKMPFVCELTSECIKEGILNLRKILTSGTMSFNFPGTNIFITGNENESAILGITGEPSVGELSDVSSDEGCTKKKKQQPVEMSVLSVSMYKRMTVDGNSTLTKIHGPIFLLDKRNRKTLSSTLEIDALSMVHKQTKVANLYEILIESATRNLRLLESKFLKELKSNADMSQPEVFHFFPEPCGHFITLVYSRNEDDDMLRSQRLLLHNQFLVPMNRPFFKKCNKFVFKNETQSNGPLINPHEGLNPSGNSGEVVLVKGKYQYYHYCQDNMDDNGWGCAYRSLQTLASWYLLQGLTDRPVPNFKEIQKCLVEIGDKGSSFIGSKQWIGSTEVNYVLNKLLGVTSKILYVNSGEELGSKGPELLNHFQTNGTPVMIGGGVLAHTILGVDYNRMSGHLKFLILDPHYTSGEDLKVIQNKGWCGWKGVDFWDKASYYNMCLPQVPHDI